MNGQDVTSFIVDETQKTEIVFDEKHPPEAVLLNTKGEPLNTTVFIGNIETGEVTAVDVIDGKVSRDTHMGIDVSASPDRRANVLMIGEKVVAEITDEVFDRLPHSNFFGGHGNAYDPRPVDLIPRVRVVPTPMKESKATPIDDGICELFESPKWGKLNRAGRRRLQHQINKAEKKFHKMNA